MQWRAFFLLMGTVFGWLLSRSGATDYDAIQGMFLLENFQLYGIMGTAVLVIAPGLWLIKRHGKTITGEPIVVTPKAFHRGNIVGGALFGVGWAMTGMCPGPVIVNVGEGKLYAIAAFVGVLVGAGTFGVLYERFVKALKLPPLKSNAPPAP
jgi:hypothetical protein